MRKNRSIFLIFITTAILIIILHFLFHPIRVLGMDTSIFYMDENVTLSAFFTITTSFLIGFLTLINIEKIKEIKERFLSCLFGFFFIFLSLDEYFEIHEYTNTLIKGVLRKENFFGQLANFSWIFPLSVFILLVFLSFLLKIFWEKKRQVKVPFLLGSFCFIFVLVFELLESATYGQNVYLIFVGFEEGLEMIGVSFFLLSTLNKIKN